MRQVSRCWGRLTTERLGQIARARLELSGRQVSGFDADPLGARCFG
jgi:hypothetical protein